MPFLHLQEEKGDCTKKSILSPTKCWEGGKKSKYVPLTPPQPGVYILQIIDIFASPFFQNNIFFQGTVKISSFPLFSTSYSLGLRIFFK